MTLRVWQFTRPVLSTTSANLCMSAVASSNCELPLLGGVTISNILLLLVRTSHSVYLLLPAQYYVATQLRSVDAVDAGDDIGRLCLYGTTMSLSSAPSPLFMTSIRAAYTSSQIDRFKMFDTTCIHLAKLVTVPRQATYTNWPYGWVVNEVYYFAGVSEL